MYGLGKHFLDIDPTLLLPMRRVINSHPPTHNLTP
jgi:hypothetical protein